jgi:FYVE, RhoGEF and PH domain containing 5/6
MPILASLDTPHPLLERSELTGVFSNFIDIWNLHRSFFSSLSDLFPPSDSDDQSKPLPPVSPILLSHFPYLSLYSPFVTAFPSSLSTLANLLADNRPFADFVAQQESDPRCSKLKLRDWLLTIVQRCPRYLLLLKDLISCTDPADAEYGKLNEVHALVSKSMYHCP